MIQRLKCLLGVHDFHWRSTVNEKKPSGWFCSCCGRERLMVDFLRGSR